MKNHPNNKKEDTHPEESMLDMIRRIGDLAMEETKQEMHAAASSQQAKSETISHASQREMAAQSVLRNGKASSIEEARKLVDEAI